MLTYGFGAKTIKGKGNACDLFSLTGDFMDPMVDTEEQLLNCYAQTLKNVELTLPVQFKRLIKHACDLAQYDLGHNENKNYFVLTILMAGVIDDF